MENKMRQIRKLKTEAQEKLKEVEKRVGLSIVEPIIANLKEEYDGCQEVIDYLDDVKEDIVENLNKFKNKDEDKKQKLPFAMPQNDNGSFFKRYKINLLVDNSDTEGAPVIYETNPTYYNLFGKTEGKSQFGAITTDFTMIKSGAIHKANGGYLILQARDVLTSPLSWDTLKRTLINEEVVVENIGEQYRSIPVKTLKPEAIDIDLKVIMIGNPMIYQILYNYDEEFKKLFKIKADFDVEMERTGANMKKFASFISHISRREEIKHFTANAVSKVIEYSSRLTGDRTKLSTRFNELLELIFEANSEVLLRNGSIRVYEYIDITCYSCSLAIRSFCSCFQDEDSLFNHFLVELRVISQNIVLKKFKCFYQTVVFLLHHFFISYLVELVHVVNR